MITFGRFYRRGGAAGASAVARGVVEVVGSNKLSSEFANGFPYVPLSHGTDLEDYISFDQLAVIAGTFAVTVHYVMSASASANVRLRADRNVVAAGGNPTQAITNGTLFTLATSNDVLDHQLTSSASADLSFSVTLGAKVFFKLTRFGDTTDGDTHAGDFRVEAVEWSITP